MPDRLTDPLRRRIGGTGRSGVGGTDPFCAGYRRAVKSSTGLGIEPIYIIS